MTFGQQPQGGNTPNNNLNGQQPQYQYQYNAQQPQYGQSQYQQYGYAQNGTAAINTQATYAYEEAQRVSVTRAYGEMTIGLLVTAVVAIVTQMTGLYITFLQYTGIFGVFAPAIVQIVLAVYLGARITRMTPSSARVMFYVYAALMGFTLSSIFMVYDLGSIGVALGVTAAFFFALTMFGMTTKFNMLKAGPILMIGLIVLIISQIVLAFVQVDGTTKIVCAIGLILFAGMTIYDAQSTRALLTEYEAQGPEMVKKISILCALNLYLDFVNMFLYILQLLGNRD